MKFLWTASESSKTQSTDVMRLTLSHPITQGLTSLITQREREREEGRENPKWTSPGLGMYLCMQYFRDNVVPKDLLNLIKAFFDAVLKGNNVL